MLENLASLVLEGRDNLTDARILQAYHSNKNRGPCEIYDVGDLVMLTTPS